MKYYIDYRVSGDFIRKEFESEEEQMKAVSAFEGSRKGSVRVDLTVPANGVEPSCP